MSGRGCQILLSPCNMSPSMSVMGGHRLSPQRANLGCCVDADKVRKRVERSFASESQNVVLPSLCLRRQVLTTGKDLNVPARPLHKQVPAYHGPAASATQTGPCSYTGTHFKNTNAFFGF